MADKPTSVGQYLATLPADVRERVEQIRAVIHEVVPDGEDVISYAIPAVKLAGKIVVYYSGWRQHVSMYPIPQGTAAFEKRMAPYIAGKGTLKFPLSDPLPVALIKDVVRAHVKRCELAAEASKSKSVAKPLKTPKRASKT
jgi:uncharacterized protein YdhG (YjbR/CyaY superfamily)